ncbi:MAG: ATP phosphoribosyltransferase regulatory subunit [Clostridia bacterium]|nr:ATP phosphoribosyltransferase regulatory subunit [Clostridia bacterium]
MDLNLLKNDEKAVFQLRSLYNKYGYSQYKMSKFEEYDLYVRNKDFLVSDNVITFTDTNGKLMALKPDVTLSIIKNTEDLPGTVHKVYYNENVYRISGGTQSFKEIMQAGLECIGDIDDYCICEVITLAAESLKNISDEFVLDISHLGILSAVIESLGVSSAAVKKLTQAVGEKNAHAIGAICEAEGKNPDLLKKLVSTYGSLDKVSPVLDELPCKEEVSRLKSIISALEKSGLKGKIRIDFSVIGDMNYYNGFVFKGFINGVATGILSGGQYDNLMQKMGRKSGAIGFAVYLDLLERLTSDKKQFDVDTVMLYDDSIDFVTVKNAVNLMIAGGNSVMAQKQIPDKIRYRQLVKITEEGVETLENNA